VTLTGGSLFTGCGALDRGMEQAGIEIRFQVEVDDYARRVLARHWPDVPRHGDIRGLTGEELEPVDVLFGGFPCSDISNAGSRAGLSGADSGLWRDMLRAVRLVRPRYVVVENVAALLNRGMGTVLGDLAESGFDAEWDRLSACEFGAPHTRERVFIVAYAPGERREWGRGAGQGSALLEPEGRGQEHGRAWAPESRPRGVAYGIGHRTHRLRLTGNAVVPAVGRWIGQRVVEAAS
jgi:DNA (cytosine-5)-methyltransferase 1